MNSHEITEVKIPIDPDNESSVERWAKKLDASADQIREAVRAVGANPSDVELYLKGTRSTTNTENVSSV